MKTILTYKAAVPSDSKLLSETAFISKQSWGYPDDWMKIWRTDLEISEEYILNNKVVKVYCGDGFIGFFSTITSVGRIAEIDHLWLLPDQLRKGYGKVIFSHIIASLKLSGRRIVRLIAEPNALGFYKKMNGKVVGQFQGKIPGRVLDIFEFRTEI